MNPRHELTDLTICRAFFAAWVFAYHVDLYLNFSRVLGPVADLIRHGYLGVDGFFILSGLILARVHPEIGGEAQHNMAAHAPLRFQLPSAGVTCRFWGKRLARIYPVHLASIVVLACLIGGGLAVGWMPRDPSRFGLISLLQNLFLVQGWGGISQGAWNYPSWSVSTEWAGYLVFPIAWYLMAYSGEVVSLQILIAGFTVTGLVYFLNGQSLNLAFADGLYRFFPEFLVGIATTRIVHVVADVSAIRLASLAGGSFMALLGASLGFDLLAVVGIWLVLFAFLMQADAERPAILGCRLALTWLGRRSYSFYMTFAIAELLMSQYFRHHGWTPQSHGLIFGVGMLTITLGLALSFYTMVETPCRQLADRWLMVPAPVQT